MNFELDKDEQITCKGPIYRADVYQGQTARGLVLSVRLNLVKKLSCPGCKHCYGIHDSLPEVSVAWPVEDIEMAEDGRLYTLIVANREVDWETGICDYWDLKLVPVQEELG